MMADTNQSMDRYQIRKQIGIGGMGTVYQAWDREIERDVALKWLPESFSAEKNFVERFRREARFIARLEHPHIVPIYDVGEYQGRPFIIMRLLSGGTLRNRLGRPDFGLNELMRAMTQISDALMSAHSQNIVHRDIKPGNILFDDRGTAFLSDFGVAKLLDAATMLTGSGVVGTPAYMSPEQFIGHEIDGRSDQYALAVVIYEALSGQLPFDGNTVQMMYKHLNTDPPEIDLANMPSLAGLNQVLKKALAKNPNDRYESVQAFVADARKITDALGRNRPLALPVAAPITRPPSAFVTPSGLSIPASQTPSPRSSAPTEVDTSTPPGAERRPVPPPVAGQSAPATQRPSVWSTPSRPLAEEPAADASAAAQTPAPPTRTPVTRTPASRPAPESRVPQQPKTGQPVTGQPATGQPATGRPSVDKPPADKPPTPFAAASDATVVEGATPLPPRPSPGATRQPSTRQPSTRPPVAASVPTVLDEAAVTPAAAPLPPTRQVTPAPTPTASGGFPGWMRAAAGLVVLLLVVAAGWWLFSGLGGGNGGGEAATPDATANPGVVVGAEETAAPSATAEPTEAASPTEAATATATNTTEPTATVPAAVLVQVIAEEANLLEGPGEVYPVIGRVERGDQLEVVAKSADGEWYNIGLPNSPTLRAWIASSAVTPLNKDAIAGVEVAATVPAPPAGAATATTAPTTAPTVAVATTAATLAPTQPPPTNPPPTNPPPTNPPPTNPPPTDPPPPPPTDPPATDPPPPPPTYTPEPPPPPPATYTPEPP